jgi:hypothetical protein
MNVFDALKGTELEDCLSVVDGEPYLVFYIDDSDPKEQWDEYCFLSERLSDLGVEFKDPYTEHDCISGTLQLKETNPK